MPTTRSPFAAVVIQLADRVHARLQAFGEKRCAAALRPIAKTKAADVALLRRDGAALRQVPGLTRNCSLAGSRGADVDPAGVGTALIRRGDTILGALR
ncbi:hypothetical protein ACQP2F_16340 [Actinoplanes sp. CA-030573]|uniref:hypothetical protein n=1 Tax=Actinoplanes sp. CA-030573 TaxID=3239898 RepID=UPI003D89BEA2